MGVVVVVVVAVTVVVLLLFLHTLPLSLTFSQIVLYGAGIVCRPHQTIFHL